MTPVAGSITDTKENGFVFNFSFAGVVHPKDTNPQDYLRVEAGSGGVFRDKMVRHVLPLQ